MCQKLYLFSYLNICRTILYMNVKFCGVCMCFQNYFRGTWVKGWMAPHIAMKHFWRSVEKCSIQSNPRRLCHLVAAETFSWSRGRDKTCPLSRKGDALFIKYGIREANHLFIRHMNTEKAIQWFILNIIILNPGNFHW